MWMTVCCSWCWCKLTIMKASIHHNPLPLISCDQTCTTTTTTSSSCDNEESQFWHKYTIDDFFHHFECHALLPGYTNDYVDDDAAHPPPPSPRTLEELELNPNELQKTIQIIHRIRSKYISDVHPASIGNAEQLFESVFNIPIMVDDETRHIDGCVTVGCRE